MANSGIGSWPGLKPTALKLGLSSAFIAPSVIAPLTWATGLKIPSLTQGLFKDATLFAPVKFVIPGLTTSFLESIRTSLPSWEEMAHGVFPNNIVAADADINISDLKTWMLAEGLPIAWVPRASTIEALHRAETPAARRVVFARRWQSVLRDCEDLLAQTRSAEVAPFAAFAQKAVAGVRAGHHELAQAFVANTLDTTILRWMPQSLRQKVTVVKTRQDPSTFSSRQFFAFAQIQGIYMPFYPDKGDPIPASFNRHGAAHGVSRRQYSRINSVLGVAHLTSWLWFIDNGFSRSSPPTAHGSLRA